MWVKSNFMSLWVWAIYLSLDIISVAHFCSFPWVGCDSGRLSMRDVAIVWFFHFWKWKYNEQVSTLHPTITIIVFSFSQKFFHHRWLSSDCWKCVSVSIWRGYFWMNDGMPGVGKSTLGFFSSLTRRFDVSLYMTTINVPIFLSFFSSSIWFDMKYHALASCCVLNLNVSNLCKKLISKSIRLGWHRWNASLFFSPMTNAKNSFRIPRIFETNEKQKSTKRKKIYSLYGMKSAVFEAIRSIVRVFVCFVSPVPFVLPQMLFYERHWIARYSQFGSSSFQLNDSPNSTVMSEMSVRNCVKFSLKKQLYAQFGLIKPNIESCSACVYHFQAASIDWNFAAKQFLIDLDSIWIISSLLVSTFLF